jgi:hypothetical protein
VRIKIIATVICALVTGCGGAAENGEGSGAVTSLEGADSANAAIRDLPAGLPAYPSAEEARSSDITGTDNGQPGRRVSFTTTDEPKQVIEYYAAAAQRLGIEVANRTADASSATMTLTRDRDMITIAAIHTGLFSQVTIVAVVL